MIALPMELISAIYLSNFRLLDTWSRHSGRALDRSELIDSAPSADSLAPERSIDVHIRSLKKSSETKPM
ncbi:MAG: winged helix-turn-helix domain-containing protein [Pirellulales bacterium]|jgi:DNA-binding response OmpR family regulator